jgi:hypothetical protein
LCSSTTCRACSTCRRIRSLWRDLIFPFWCSTSPSRSAQSARRGRIPGVKPGDASRATASVSHRVSPCPRRSRKRARRAISIEGVEPRLKRALRSRSWGCWQAFLHIGHLFGLQTYGSGDFTKPIRSPVRRYSLRWAEFDGLYKHPPRSDHSARRKGAETDMSDVRQPRTSRHYYGLESRPSVF